MNNTTIVSQTSKEKGDLDWLPILVFLSPMIFYFFVYLYKSIEYRISQCCIDKPNKKKDDTIIIDRSFELVFPNNKVSSYGYQDCSICFEKIIKEKNKNVLNCQHLFCTQCLESWVFRRLEENLPINCPICRKEITFDKNYKI